MHSKVEVFSIHTAKKSWKGWYVEFFMVNLMRLVIPVNL